MAEYIGKEKAMKICLKHYNDSFTDIPAHEAIYALAVDINNVAPSADVVEVVYGEWKFNKDGSGTCNQCGITQKNVWDYDGWQNYCGHCGAKMDKKE